MKAYEKTVKRHEKKRAVPFNISLTLTRIHKHKQGHGKDARCFIIGGKVTKYVNKCERAENPQFYLI